MDEGTAVDIVYLDFAKAVDKVTHKRRKFWSSMGLKNNNFWVKWDVDNPNNPSVPPETKFNMFGYAQINFHSYFKSSAIWAQCVLYS